jgi:hypothetical protein
MLFISVFSSWFFVSLLLIFSILFLGFLDFNCSFSFCFVCVNVWEKVNHSFVCWAIVETKTHATSD